MANTALGKAPCCISIKTKYFELNLVCITIRIKMADIACKYYNEMLCTNSQ